MKPVDPLNVEPIEVGKYIWTTIVFNWIHLRYPMLNRDVHILIYDMNIHMGRL